MIQGKAKAKRNLRKQKQFIVNRCQDVPNAAEWALPTAFKPFGGVSPFVTI